MESFKQIRPIPEKALTPAQAEAQIDEILISDNTIPDKKKKEWAYIFDNDPEVDPIALLKEIKDFKIKIQQTKELDFEIDVRKTGLSKEALSQSVSDIIALIEESEQYGNLLGEGNVAFIFFHDKYPNYCFKVIKDVSSRHYRMGNSVDYEMDLLDLLNEMIKIDGIRAPEAKFSIRKGDKHIMVIERLDAVNLEDILLGRVAVPPDFDFDSCISKLEKYVEAMHSNNIYHRDLHDRNIMINIETGELFVIDPGRSIHHPVGENPYFLEEHNLELKDDNEYLKEHIRALRIMRNKQKNLNIPN
ncbi:hypothetical protein ISS03_01335 [Patescibacteria group bacterium]|nr:hypothetical protein [Patescibacteria group bacterium]